MRYNKNIGALGEEFAANVLENKGFEILERNYMTKVGELDVIAKKDSTLHFIEVKTRTEINCGYPSEAVTEEKMRHIRNAAQIYMNNKKISWLRVSFDVFEVMTNMLTDCM